MHWIAKAAIQKSLSSLPCGERVNYLLQARVTKRIPARDDLFLGRVDAAINHVRHYENHARAAATEANAYEFGAGWELIAPFAMWMLGVGRQHLIDIEPHVRLELLNNSIGRFRRLHDEIERRAGRELRPMPEVTLRSLDDLERHF